MKSLRSELRPSLIGLGAFSFFMNLLFLVPALFMSQVFDRVLTTYSGETLLVLLAGTSMALLLLLVLDYVRSRLQTVLGTLIEEHLSPRVVSATVTRQARAHAESTPDGLRDVATLGAVFSANGIVAVLDAPWVVVYVAFIWASHPLLGLCAGIAAVIMLGLAWVNHRLSQTTILSVQKDSRRAARYVESSLRNAEVLYGLGMAEALIERWRGMQERIHTAQSNAHRMAAMFSAGTRSFRQQIQVVMLALGAYLVITGKASAGIMIATTILLGRALQPVEQLVASWRTLTEARAAYARLKVLAETVGDLEHAPMELPRPSGKLTAEGLILRSPDSERIVLHNISFHLDSGQALAIVGPSAAGKSSLVRLLIGVWRPTAGTVRLDGADVALWSRVELGRWIGYVPQDVELFDGTVAENIARLGGVDAQAVVAAARRADAHDLILSLSQGYETQVGEGGANLSPGQRQRIALARALYGNPRFVVLDEPNSNLDGVGELALARVIDRLRGDGVTVVVITHRPSLIAHVDTVLVVEGGRMQQFVPASHFLQAIKTRAQMNSVAVAA